MTVDNDVTGVRARWESIIGTPFVGAWFSVAADRVASFEHASYFEDSGTVENNGSEDPYPEGLVEGFHLLALLDHFGGQVIEMDSPGYVGWNYGLNRVRFVTPVHVGNRLRLQATVVDVTPKDDDAFLITVSYVAELEGASRPAFTAEMIAYQAPLSAQPDPRGGAAG